MVLLSTLTGVTACAYLQQHGFGWAVAAFIRAMRYLEVRVDWLICGKPTYYLRIHFSLRAQLPRSRSSCHVAARWQRSLGAALARR